MGGCSRLMCSTSSFSSSTVLCIGKSKGAFKVSYFHSIPFWKEYLKFSIFGNKNTINPQMTNNTLILKEYCNRLCLIFFVLDMCFFSFDMVA